MVNKTEFHCERYGITYWSSVETAEAERINDEMQRWTIEPTEVCPWCVERHTRTMVAPAPLEGSERR